LGIKMIANVCLRLPLLESLLAGGLFHGNGCRRSVLRGSATIQQQQTGKPANGNNADS
jgi:hypothetical protein